MAKRERKPVHHVQITDGKRAINNFCKNTIFRMQKIFRSGCIKGFIGWNHQRNDGSGNGSPSWI